MNTLREALQEYLELRRSLASRCTMPACCCPASSVSWRRGKPGISAPASLSSGRNIRRFNPQNGPGAFVSCAALPATAVPLTAARKFRRSASCPIGLLEPDLIYTQKRKYSACWKRHCYCRLPGRRRRCGLGVPLPHRLAQRHRPAY